MPNSSPRGVSPENELLSSLVRKQYELLFSDLESVQLAQGKVLFEAGEAIEYAYFPRSGKVSLFAGTEGGRVIEVAEVGREGVVGLPAVLGIYDSPYRAVVQIRASAKKIKAETLCREFNRGPELQRLLLAYSLARLAQVSQALVCNHFHTVEQRFCRWLLMTRDRVNTNRFALTQQQISDILGTSRTNVTMCATVLKDQKIIRCTRGRITIIDEQALESSACICYREMKQEKKRILAA